MCDVLYGQAAVAQSVERPTAKQNIVGSSPSQGKKFQGKNVKPTGTKAEGAVV